LETEKFLHKLGAVVGPTSFYFLQMREKRRMEVTFS